MAPSLRHAEVLLPLLPGLPRFPDDAEHHCPSRTFSPGAFIRGAAPGARRMARYRRRRPRGYARRQAPGRRPQPNEGGGDLAQEVLTSSASVRVLIEGPDAVTARMVLRRSKGTVHECDGSRFLAPEEKKGQPCGCPPLLEDKKLAARNRCGPTPTIDLTFRIAAAPRLGEFHFRTGSWQMTAQLSDLIDALEHVAGPAVCDLSMELVVFTTRRAGASAIESR